MNEIVAKLLRLKTPLKIAVTAGAMAVLGVIYYLMFYSDLSDAIASAKSRQTALVTEKEGYEKRKREYLAYRNELKQLQEEQRELLKMLPTSSEIPTLMSSLTDLIDLSGLENISMSFEGEAPEDLYVRIPVKMDLRGPYHGVAKFFKSLSELRRIVNIENLSMTAERAAQGADPGAPVKVRAKFTAVTFKYQEPGGAKGGGV